MTDRSESTLDLDNLSRGDRIVYALFMRLTRRNLPVVLGVLIVYVAMLWHLVTTWSLPAGPHPHDPGGSVLLSVAEFGFALTAIGIFAETFLSSRIRRLERMEEAELSRAFDDAVASQIGGNFIAGLRPANEAPSPSANLSANHEPESR